MCKDEWNKIQELVIYSVSYLISEMQFDDKEIVNFAECIERFPSATMEKVQSEDKMFLDWYSVHTTGVHQSVDNYSISSTACYSKLTYLFSTEKVLSINKWM